VNKLLIVGYDPGTTAALAIIDTKAEIISIKSKRGFKKKEIIETITEEGKPLIIATDRYPLPKSVKKIASTLGCKYYHPPKSLSNKEKNELVKEFTEELDNDHESDALASALRAFKDYSKLFKKTESTLSSLGLRKFYERVVESLVLGKVKNLNDAIDKVMEEVRKPRKNPVRKKIDESPVDKRVSKLREKIKILEKDIDILKKHNQGLKKKSREREKYYKKKLAKKVDLSSPVAIQHNIDKMKQKINEKDSVIQELKNLRKIELEGFIPILELEEARKAKDLHEKIGLGDRIVRIKNLTNAQILNDYKIKALISSIEPDEKILEKVNFPIIIEKDISIEKVNNILAVKKQEFEKKVLKAKKVGFEKWLKGHRKRKL
jgi:hypothetical protein